MISPRGASSFGRLGQGLRLLADKRHALRYRTFKAGRITFNNGHSTFDCVVRNLSASGARLEVASTVGIPETFVVELEDGSPIRWCGVAWRSAQALGVYFDLVPLQPQVTEA